VTTSLDRSAVPEGPPPAGGPAAFAAIALENERLRAELQESRGQRERLEGVAHDVNNVLAAISGASELLLHRLAPAEPALRECAARICRAAVWGASLARPMLMAGRAPGLGPVVVDLNELLAAAEPALRLLVGDRHPLVTRLAPGRCRVSMDVGLLEQIVTNLVVNARQALRPGDSVALATDLVELDQAAARRRGLPPGTYAVLTVRDTGRGMDAAIRARIFERHFTTKEPGAGNGLGLATVHAAVTGAGGAIHVTSAAGRGSTFEVYLPGLEPPGAEAVSMADRGPQSPMETVLVVEDERPVRELIRDVLRLQGYAVLEAKDGREALAASAGHPGPIHLVVLDAVLPGVTADELIVQLRGQRPGLRALYTSGYTGDVVRQRGLQTGADFLQKPFTVDALTSKVRDMLDGS
jgi:nitrogen-specific signal transduction histidine kinase/CheY-like chemotaxis protein